MAGVSGDARNKTVHVSTKCAPIFAKQRRRGVSQHQGSLQRPSQRLVYVMIIDDRAPDVTFFHFLKGLCTGRFLSFGARGGFLRDPHPLLHLRVVSEVGNFESRTGPKRECSAQAPVSVRMAVLPVAHD